MVLVVGLLGWMRGDDLATAGDTATLGGGDVAKVADLPDSVAVAFGIYAANERTTRADAMSLPAIRRGRQVIAGTIGSLPLTAARSRADEDGASVEPIDWPMLEQPDPNTTRQHVLTWTVDDLLFGGIAWWRVLRRDSTGFPRSCERIAPGRWRVQHGKVYVDDERVPDEDLVRFDGPDEGLLAYGGRTVKTALLLEQAVRRFATLDVPLGVLRLAEGAPELTPDQVDELLDSWEDARSRRSTAYLNRAVEYQAVQFDAQRVQLAEARAYMTAELARLLNLAPRYVNAPSASGMTYANVESERRDLVDTTLAPYLAAIEQRLSLGDVTPRGTVVRFDTTGLLRGSLLDVLQAVEVGRRAGVLTTGEGRELIGKPRRMDTDTDEGAPA